MHGVVIAGQRYTSILFTSVQYLKTILEYSGNVHDVDSYTAAEGKRLKKLVEGK